LLSELTRLQGVERAFAAPVFNEAVITIDQPVAPVLQALSAQGIIGGYDLSVDYPELGNALLVCATEVTSDADITTFADALGGMLGGAS
jgi:glycine dehydrogenase subunit 1